MSEDNAVFVTVSGAKASELEKGGKSKIEDGSGGAQQVNGRRRGGSSF